MNAMIETNKSILKTKIRGRFYFMNTYITSLSKDIIILDNNNGENQFDIIRLTDNIGGFICLNGGFNNLEDAIEAIEKEV